MKVAVIITITYIIAGPKNPSMQKLMASYAHIHFYWVQQLT